MNTQFSDMIHNLTDLPVSPLIPEDFPEEIPEIRNKVSLFRNSKGSRFLAAIILEEILVIGPFILDDDPLPPRTGSVLGGVEIAIRSFEKVQSYISLLKILAGRRELPGASPEEDIDTHNPVFEDSFSIDLSEVAKRYYMERELRRCIASGDREALSSLYDLKKMDFPFLSRLPNNPMRAYKNMAIVGNTIGRLSAEKGGLPPFLLHNISESIALSIEKQNTLDAILKLIMQIPRQYCDAVHNYGIENHSVTVAMACRYILEHLYEKIGLNEVADYAETSPSYLSRRFREETGLTISHYIRKKRMTEARWMLNHSSESITGIALNLGFDDVNYFSRIFRKETGISPRDYQLKSRNEDFSGLPD